MPLFSWNRNNRNNGYGRSDNYGGNGYNGRFNNNQRFMNNMNNVNMPFGFGGQPQQAAQQHWGQPQQAVRQPWGQPQPMMVQQPQPIIQTPFKTEPIDEKTAELLRKGPEAIKEAAEKERNFVFSRSDFKELSEELAVFIQNERNSALFYKYLNGICGNLKYKKIFDEMAEECENAKNEYIKIRERFSGESFSAKDSRINDRISFGDGIMLAVEEESRSVVRLAGFYEKVSGREEKEKVSALLHKKNARLAYLNLILNSKQK